MMGHKKSSGSYTNGEFCDEYSTGRVELDNGKDELGGQAAGSKQGYGPAGNGCFRLWWFGTAGWK